MGKRQKYGSEWKKRFWVWNGLQFLWIAIVIFAFLIGAIWQRLFFCQYKAESTESQEEYAVSGIYYNYYLDGTPSMMGFMNQEGSNFYLLSEALEQMNRNTGLGNDFYICTNRILEAEASEVYDVMRDRADLVASYEAMMEDGVNDILEDMDLSDIFGESNGDELFVTENGNVNIIITDLNFYTTASGAGAIHRERMQNFAKEYAQKVRLGNICIYDIHSRYGGNHTDENVQGDEAVYREDSSSFYVLVSAEDALAYGGFIDNLEKALTEKGIQYANKYEVRNSMIDNTQPLKINMQDFYDTEQTELINFNYDRKYFNLKRKLTDDAIGLRTVVGDGKSVSSIKLPVLEVKEDGEFEAIAEVYYPKGFGYEQYMSKDIIRSTWAGINTYQGKNYLKLGVEINSTVTPDIVRDYYAINVLLQMKEPICYMPDWAKTDRSENSIQKIDVSVLIEEVNKGKLNGYADVSAEEKKVGNIVIYVHF